MSGGVDSAVVAALLCEAGYDVIGVTLILWKDEGEEEKRWQDRSCCKVGVARHVAKQLAIPHHTIDVQDSFRKAVIDDFCDTYLLGQTPNPCVRCNERIKFTQLLAAARQLGSDFLATGHYARIKKEQNGFTLQKAIDPAKDQSYFLYRLNQETLASTLFPLGEMTKAQVYEKAAALGLPYEEILESQEICFVNQQDYRTVLEQYRPEAVAPGNIVTQSGDVVGTHNGVAFHTVGQRRGLGVALGTRLYVTRIDPATKEVIVGEESDLMQDTLVADQVIWPCAGSERPGHVVADENIADVLDKKEVFITCDDAASPRATNGSGPFAAPVGTGPLGLRVEAKVRYRSPEQPATIIIATGNTFKLLFDQPVRGISPGQSVVLYRGDSVVGGGIIGPATHTDQSLLFPI